MIKKILLVLIGVFTLNIGFNTYALELDNSLFNTTKPRNTVINRQIVTYYKEYKKNSLVKQYVEIFYQEELNLLSNELIDKNLDIDIDNVELQKYILSLEYFEGIDPTRLSNLVSIIDIYENHAKNEEISRLKDKIVFETNANAYKQTILENQEKLNVLMPIIDKEHVENSVSVMAYSVYNNGYDVNKALAFANLYWLNGSPIFPKYSSDCANYVSQILYMSGMKEYKKSFWPIVGNIVQEDVQNWYMYDDHYLKKPSYTWTSAPAFFYHWTHYRAGYSNSSYSMWRVGDPVGCDWESDGDTDHIIMIDGKTGNTKSTITYTGHTSSRIREPLTTIYNSHPNAFLRAIPMQYAKN